MNEGVEEINFDGLVGPTHNYAGLAPGNLASQRHQQAESHPRAAALQGLAKMQRLAELGVGQAVIPPQERPDLAFLRRLGFDGSDEQVVRSAGTDAPHLLATACSASAMWTANAATVCPSADASDGRVHFTAANLVGNLHRFIESNPTSAVLRRIFPEGKWFAHHTPLPAAAAAGDEGAANHMRLCAEHGAPGVQVFVHGIDVARPEAPRPTRHPARQTLAAAQAIARLHRLAPQRTVHLQQHPEAIDAGVFHNDVAAVSHRNLLFFHESAFLAGREAVDRIAEALKATGGTRLRSLCVAASRISLTDAVESYLFNCQILSLRDGRTMLLCPDECLQRPAVAAFLEEVARGDGPIDVVQAIDVRQSMRNGGGPACLRLRVVLTQQEREATHQGVLMNASLHDRLTAWVHRHYRQTLRPGDLLDPKLIVESHDALDALTDILNLPGLYPFQK